MMVEHLIQNIIQEIIINQIILNLVVLYYYILDVLGGTNNNRSTFHASGSVNGADKDAIRKAALARFNDNL